ncbi:hypothetical protein XEUV683_05750 [Xanthomonas euvesicatoria]|nr:hypothetical protein XEUV685_21885 [Xanthomonas euvesicatoria]KLA54501.1 hypothetical protein XEUV684_19145 [Xanthomonas euvesicatoria]KLA54995.1 hypothetical protein XEUV683_05750 [Xanthomonas euvesicatoria]KLA62850.1 hypothetical protein XEUV695_21765 [Xanthomonas euvesicatoria]KLA63770.1 hypothetical protein XEUV689_19565 [Xanthomonas euvesicatoria]
MLSPIGAACACASGVSKTIAAIKATTISHGFTLSNRVAWRGCALPMKMASCMPGKCLRVFLKSSRPPHMARIDRIAHKVRGALLSAAVPCR